jgi:hypothetical protein
LFLQIFSAKEFLKYLRSVIKVSESLLPPMGVVLVVYLDHNVDRIDPSPLVESYCL